jgi:hypothetical protein
LQWALGLLVSPSPVPALVSMSNASVSPVAVPVQTRVRARIAALAVAAVVAGGVTVHHVSQPSEPTHEAMGRVVPTPCDGFADCIYTAYWYAFLR